jgi:hypothetical protein
VGYDAVFADASENGNNVFFTTRQQLVPADLDQNVDLYDARVGGHVEEGSLANCSGEACRESNASSSFFQAPVSAAFTGRGNATPQTPTKPMPLTRTQRLARALKACHAKRNRRRRAACEVQARRRYGSGARGSGLRRAG